MGQFKRTMRGWKEDIQNTWGLLKTFHRIALGITLGIVAVYVARVNLLDPLQAELARKHKAMDQKGVPFVVPAAEEDNEIQKAQLSLENLRKSSSQWQCRMENALRQRPLVNLANRSNVLSELELLIVKSGLILQRRSESNLAEHHHSQDKNEKKNQEAENRNFPLNIWRHQYELAGTFRSVCSYLKQIGTFPYPARLCHFEFVAARDKTGENVLRGDELLIILRFHLEIYYHDN